MKMQSTNALAAKYSMSYGKAHKLLLASGVSPIRTGTGTGRGSICLWGAKAEAVLSAARQQIEFKKRSKEILAKHAAAVKAPQLPALRTDSTDGLLGDAQRSLGAILVAVIQLSRESREPVSLVQEDRVALASLQSSAQGTAVVATDTREMVSAGNRETLLAMGRHDSYLQLLAQGQTEIGDRLDALEISMGQAGAARGMAWSKLGDLQGTMTQVLDALTAPKALPADTAVDVVGNRG